MPSPPSAHLKRFVSKDRSLPGVALAAAVFAFCGPILALLVLVGQNGGAVAEPMAIVRIGVVAGLAVAVLALLLGRVIAVQVAGVGAAVFGYLFFSSGWIPLATVPVRLMVWVLAASIGTGVVTWLVGTSTRLFQLSTIALVAITIGLGVAVTQTETPENPPATLAFDDSPTRTPNVYVLVLDGFGALGALDEQFEGMGLDVAESMDALNQIGFVEEPLATTNYFQTVLSVPSTLNGEFQLTPETPLTYDERWDYSGTALSGRNALVDWFRAAGYQYWHSGSGLWDHSVCDARVADRCLGPDGTSAESVRAAWQTTPVSAWMTRDTSNAQDPGGLVDEILELRSAGDAGPYLVFGHILSPHHPYRFASDCSPAPDNQSTLQTGSRPEWRPLYIAQVNCVARQLADAMTRLVAEDPDAIVLLQGDHGPSFTLTLEMGVDWSPEQIGERFPIFRTVRMPSDCVQSGEEDAIAFQSLINTLPRLRSCLSGQPLELEEPRWFLSGFRLDESLKEFDYRSYLEGV